MNVALILVSLGIATGPEPISQALVVAYFEDMTSCVEAANQAKLPVAGNPWPVPQHLGAVRVRANETYGAVGKAKAAVQGITSILPDRPEITGGRAERFF
jgi:hypothetical protein